MKIIVDHTRCAGHGIRESLAAEVLEVNEDGKLLLHTGTVPDGHLQGVQHAVDSRPADALRLQQ